MNAGTLILGLLNGLSIGLLAVGFVLVYKSNRFLNLAHAQLGTISAILLAKAVLDWHLPWFVAFVLFVALGSAIGWAVERYVVQRLRARTSSPTALLLLSLGISQVLLAVSFLPLITPKSTADFPQPFTSHVRVGGVLLTGASLLTLVLVPVLVAGLAIFMRFSLQGKMIRAAANNPDGARLVGIPVRRVSALTWQLAGAFSAVSAILIAPTQASFSGEALGPLLLLLTIGAAAFGAFTSLPYALLGGLLLGLIDQIVAGITSSGSEAELAVFITILIVVLVRGRAIAAAFPVVGAAVDDLAALRIPSVLRSSAVVRLRRPGLALGALFLAVIWPQLPYFNTAGHQFLLTLVLIFALMGISLTMLLGWAGQVSLGSFGVTGICAFLTVRFAGDGWPLPSLCLFAAVIGALVMGIVGLPALRVRGLTLAVTTLGLAVIATDYLLHTSLVGATGSFGVIFSRRPSVAHGFGTPTTSEHAYYVALVVLALSAFAASALRRSLPGRVILAVRDNERASASLGVNAATVKLAILATSGAFAGIAGVLWSISWPVVSPSQFSADISIALVAIPVIGGLGSVAGAIGGAVFLYSLTFFIGPVVSPIFGNYGNSLAFNLFLAGAGQIAVLLRLPNGLAGAVQQRWQTMLDRRAEVAERGRVGLLSDLPLRVRGVRLAFGGIRALNEPDIVVQAGEIVGLIGTNGAGKTTLMNVISGVLKPSAGSVQVFGHEVVDLPPDFRSTFGLARSFQDASLFAGLTVRETVQLAVSNRVKIGFLSALVGAPWARAADRRTAAQADAIVARFGLESYAHLRTSELSTGTRRICDLATQVASRPKLLLLDEPTAGVAQREAERFGPLLREIRDELDCAVLIIEHDMPLLMGLCDRVYALESGAVIAEGTPEEVRSDTRVVSSYLGTDDTAIDRSGTGKAAKGPAEGAGKAAKSPARGAAKPAAPRKPRARASQPAATPTATPAAASTATVRSAS